jgi:hypothetical protein
VSEERATARSIVRLVTPSAWGPVALPSAGGDGLQLAKLASWRLKLITLDIGVDNPVGARDGYCGKRPTTHCRF